MIIINKTKPFLHKSQISPNKLGSSLNNQTLQQVQTL